MILFIIGCIVGIPIGFFIQSLFKAAKKPIKADKIMTISEGIMDEVFNAPANLFSN